MAEKTITTRQKQKYDTSTNWTANNIVLLAGEIGIESDTNKFKVGNGTSAWNELDYAGGSEIPLYSTTGQNTDGAMTQKATTDALPQAVSFDLSPELNFDSISMTNEQFNLLLANPENVLIVNVVDDNDDTMTFSWIFHRSQYMKITTDEVTQELLTFNCDEATQAGSVAQVIQNLTFVRLSTSPDIVVMDYRIDFTSFATRSDLTDYVPKTRTINGKSLSNDIILTATDVNALPDTTEIPSTLADLTEDSTHRTVTDSEKNTWNAKSDFSGSYNDLTDKPTIPTINVNGTPQSTINFDSDPQTQINNIVNNTTLIQNSSGGFNAGTNSVAHEGGAIGKNASSLHGGSIGNTAITDEGGAVGYQAISTNGGAIGQGTQTSNGFAGGYNAKTISGGLNIDAIQLGTGTNTQTKTLQVYDDNIYDANTHNLSLLGSFSALNNIGGGFSISDPVNVGIELGRKDGTSGTPYIDFHTDGQASTDFNSRILASGSELQITASGGVSINGYNIASVIQEYMSGTTGYLRLNTGDREYLICWGVISQSFRDKDQYNFTLPNNLTYNNQSWHLSVTADGYTDAAQLNGRVSANNGFYLQSQRYSNRTQDLVVSWQASGFVS